MKDNIHNDKLKNQLSNHYQQKQLSEQQIEALQAISASSPRSPHYRIYGAVAACTVLAFVGFFYQPSQPHVTTISKDIAYNHNSQMQMEILSPELRTVQGRLNKLGFQLVSSSKFEKGKWQLIGGRYCNINGKIAAQMKLRNSESKAIYTFYQAKVPNEFTSTLNDNETAIDGVKVKLWREKGLLMGLAF